MLNNVLLLGKLCTVLHFQKYFNDGNCFSIFFLPLFQYHTFNRKGGMTQRLAAKRQTLDEA